MSEQKDKKKDVAKEYEKPQVKSYGDFVSLTQGTKGGNKSENGKPKSRVSGSPS